METLQERSIRKQSNQSSKPVLFLTKELAPGSWNDSHGYFTLNLSYPNEVSFDIFLIPFACIN